MKICKKCGAYQKDSRTFCIDCNESLGDSISKKEEAVIRKKASDQAEKALRNADFLSPTTGDKIIGGCSIVGFIVTIVTLIIRAMSNYLSSEIVASYIFSLILFIFSACYALFPKAFWALEKMRLSSMIYSFGEIVPSDSYCIGRTIFVYVFFIFSLLMSLFSIFYPR